MRHHGNTRTQRKRTRTQTTADHCGRQKVFSDKGFNKAIMEDIAQEAELSPGTLYLYFKNKEELYASLSLRILQYLLISLDHVATQEDQSPEAKLDAMIRAMYDVYEFDPLIIINMFHLQSSETLKNLSSEFLSEIEILSKKSHQRHGSDFSEGTEKGVFIDKHPVALADVFLVHFFRNCALGSQ